jgi:hypothetical protein
MALPLSRNTTYAPGSQVQSDDLNDLQDAAVANGGSATLWQTLHPGLVGDANVVATSAEVGVEASAGSAEVIFPCLIDLRPGDVITAIHAIVDAPGGTNEIGVELKRGHLPAGFVTAVIGTVTVTDETGSSKESSGALAHTLAVDTALYWRVVMDTAAQKVYAVGITFHRPLATP